MSDFYNNRFTLAALYFVAMGKGFLRYRNPYRAKAWKHRVEFYERAWEAAARDLGADYSSLGSDIFEITLNGRRTRVSDNASEIDDAMTLQLLSDKVVTHRVLQREGLSIPRHCDFTKKHIDRAIDFLKRHRTGAPEKRCVVKPVRGTGGGRGITTGIQSRAHLACATAEAAIYCDDLIIEEQIAGANYRLLYLDGELIDAFVRRQPFVIGDGRSNVKKLVALANEERLLHKSARSQTLLTIDSDMHRTLAAGGLSLGAVPAVGQQVNLKTVVNENCGADNSTVTDELSPELIEEGARAVAALGVRLGGVDVITQNPGLSLAESGGVILEVNAPPNFYYHYHKKDGEFPVALYVLRRLLIEDENSKQIGKPSIGRAVLRQDALVTTGDQPW